MDRPLPPGFREVANGVYLGPSVTLAPDKLRGLQVVVYAGGSVAVSKVLRGGPVMDLDAWTVWAFGEVSHG